MAPQALGPAWTGWAVAFAEPSQRMGSLAQIVIFIKVWEVVMGLTAQQLLVLITEHPWGVPVRDMEALLALGQEAVISIVAFMEQRLGVADEAHEGDLLWPTVVLGELRDPRGAPMLLRLLQEARGLEVPVAAAEGLAKTGAPALGPLLELLGEGPEPRDRILVYAALAGMRLRKAWEVLEGALEADPELDFAVARALAERGQPGDVELLYRAYLETEPWKRAVFEETIAGLMGGRCPWSVPFQGWRLRYRRQPRQDLKVHRRWPDVLIMLWENRHLLHSDKAAGLLSLEELRYRATLRQKQRICPDCGQALRSPTGVPLCGEVEEDLIEFQLDRVREWLAHRWEDIHEVLDELDRHELEALQLPEGSHEERAWKAEALESIDVLKSTLCWMVEEGISGLSQGEKRLWAALQRARARAK